MAHKQELWDEAKRKCRLGDEEIRMAREAVRLMSRSAAKQSFTVSAFKKEMERAGVYSSSVGSGTLDECPMAYKGMDDMQKQLPQGYFYE